jgi:hypothetical protein
MRREEKSQGTAFTPPTRRGRMGTSVRRDRTRLTRVLSAVRVVELHDRVAQPRDRAGDVHAVLVLPAGPLRRGVPDGGGGEEGEGRGASVGSEDGMVVVRPLATFGGS